jgi:hypothetical protein
LIELQTWEEIYMEECLGFKAGLETQARILRNTSEGVNRIKDLLGTRRSIHIVNWDCLRGLTAPIDLACRDIGVEPEVKGNQENSQDPVKGNRNLDF